ncbi:ribonuclease Z [Flavobacterium sp.]|uniref:ribonuclease Z n=1 Tax=Flavobacterium sp. TaxID=239 RepID=UPI001229AA46|nr:ribonuclease Z [Flavobacterium sp.]RZJ72931.1 MAG: ribonuclease Z [Flavobacterium sp.]
MKLTILGCYAATPRTFTNPTSQVLEIRNRLFLIDCAEGTQVALRKNKVKFTRIEHIFISHLHGDHFYGLIGLISSFTLYNRQNDLHVYGPKGVKEIILLQLRLANSFTGFNLYFHELTSKESELVYEDEKVTVHTIPLKHRIYTNGYLFREKVGLRKLDVGAAEKYGVDKVYYRNIVLGKDITLDNGTLVPNSALTTQADAPKSYAFCSDTLYNEEMLPLVKDVDMMYHEATFLESEAELAIKTMHSTAIQAATIAKLANVKTLLLGHYSTRYDSIEKFREEANTVFGNVLLADDGLSFDF